MWVVQPAFLMEKKPKSPLNFNLVGLSELEPSDQGFSSLGFCSSRPTHNYWEERVTSLISICHYYTQCRGRRRSPHVCHNG
jgi:hypothetical protein